MVTTSNNTENNIDRANWFDLFVANIRVDQLLMETNVLEKHKEKVYKALISGDEEFMHDYARKASSIFFIENLIESYFIELVERKSIPKRLALDLSNSKVLVWAEIETDDERTEDGLILAAAKINYQFSKYGFHIATTIVEEEDNLEFPNHYKEVEIKEA